MSLRDIEREICSRCRRKIREHQWSTYVSRDRVVHWDCRPVFQQTFPGFGVEETEIWGKSPRKRRSGR